MKILLKDLRFAARMFLRSPGFTAVMIVSLTLGIGANSAVFSLINGILLRPLPHIAEPDQLVRIFTTRTHTPGTGNVSYPDYLDYRENAGDVFADVMVHSPIALSFSTGGRPEFTFGYIASGNYFSMLGVQAVIGRTFTSDEDRNPGEHPVTVLSHRFWQRRFGSDPDAVGRTVRLNGHPFTIIGIAPEEFIGTEVIVSADFWIPMMMQAQVLPSVDLIHDREARILRTTARLNPGVGVDEARARIRTLGQNLAQEYPDANGDVGVGLVPEAEARIEVGLNAPITFAAAMLLFLVALVLLIACANVANMLLARAVGRRREIGIRLAIGAGRRRLIRQLLTESVLVSLIGGALGLVLAFWIARLLERVTPPANLPLGIEVPLDFRVLVFTLLVSVAAGMIFGLAPAIQASGTNLVLALKNDSGQHRGRSRRWTLGNLLVVAQVAVSLVLLISAGLFLRSLRSAQAVDLGMDPRHVLAVEIDLDMRGYSEDAGKGFYRELVARVGRLPGVEAVSLARPVPMGWSANATDVAREGEQLLEDRRQLLTMYSVVGEDYFATLSTPLVRGRGFEPRDDEDQPLRVIVNQTLVKRLWPDDDPLGKRVQLSALGGEIATVIGVAGDGKYRMVAEEPLPYLYLPLRQLYRAATTLVVRTAADPNAMLETVRREIHTLDGDLALVAQPLEALVSDRALMPIRLAAAIAGAFGLLGTLLAAVGLYGVMSYAVSRRTPEIGMRMALGAGIGNVLMLVLGQAMLLTLTGMGIGLVLTWAFTRLLSNLLVGVSPFDPLTFVAMSAGLVAVAWAASFVPAYRAIRVDPSIALRAE